jgi:hypothetical protein
MKQQPTGRELHRRGVQGADGGRPRGIGVAMASTSGAGSPRQAAAQRGPTRREPSSKPPRCRGCSSTLATADSTYPHRSRLPRDGRGGACVGVGEEMGHAAQHRMERSAGIGSRTSPTSAQIMGRSEPWGKTTVRRVCGCTE